MPSQRTKWIEMLQLAMHYAEEGIYVTADQKQLYEMEKHQLGDADWDEMADKTGIVASGEEVAPKPAKEPEKPEAYHMEMAKLEIQHEMGMLDDETFADQCSEPGLRPFSQKRRRMNE